MLSYLTTSVNPEIWLYTAVSGGRTRKQTAQLLFVAVTLDHPVECASIDAENLGGARAIAAGDV